MKQMHPQELSSREKSAIRKLVMNTCANYDHEYGCLLLDGTCYMFTIGFRHSRLCRYFREALPPTSPTLEAMFMHKPAKPCKRCGRKFPVAGRKLYCSPACVDVARKAATAKRVRKHRNQSFVKCNALGSGTPCQ